MDDFEFGKQETALAWFTLKETPLVLFPEKSFEDVTKEQADLLLKEARNLKYSDFVYPWTIYHPDIGDVTFLDFTEFEEVLEAFSDYCEWMHIKDF